MGELKYMERRKQIRIINLCKIAWDALRKRGFAVAFIFYLKCFKGACAVDYVKDSFLLNDTSLFLKHLQETPQQLAELWVRIPSP